MPDSAYPRPAGSPVRGGELAEAVAAAMLTAGFVPSVRGEPVATAADVAVLSEAGLGKDYRSTVEGDAEHAPLSWGLAFDPERVRSQAVMVRDVTDGAAEMIITVTVAPRRWAAQQRFFARERDGVRTADFAGVIGETPEFVISPSWTQVVPSRRRRHARGAVRAHIAALTVLAAAAPPGTWFQLGAQGTWPWDERDRLAELTSQPVGTVITAGSLPFGLGALGEPRDESRCTRTFGRFLGWRELPGIGDGGTLGSVFAQPLPWFPPPV